ncbi:MAG: tetratricopeptide repeat protein, partial [Anaerolineae bacterium]|nr:tetratricopeptide repeat protein [Anaerolineae bacterium]
RSLQNLAHFLSALGRPQEALPLAQEALAIRRRLAEVNPDAFLPDLAMSLHNLAKFLSAQGRPQEALPLALEAVQTLAPFFAGLPRAFAKWMGGFLRNYLHLCAEVGAAPALDLPPAVQEKLRAVTGNAGLPTEMRELAGRLLALCGGS